MNNPVLGWRLVASDPPPKGALVDTKIYDEDGIRNECKLKLGGRLWWHSDGSMYVYYTPTHWRFIPPQQNTNKI